MPPRRLQIILRSIGAGIIVMPLVSCSGTRPATLGIKDGRLSACPPSPNCVSSDAADAAHEIAPFDLAVPAANAWRALRAAVESLPRTKIIMVSEDYLYAECSSAVFGFVDDLELHLRSAQNSIAVRSASRLGKSDFGVNQKRVENLRGLLIERGVVRKVL